MRAAFLFLLPVSLVTACGGAPADLVLRFGGDECRSDDVDCPVFDLGPFEISGDLEERVKVVNDGEEPGRVFSGFIEQEAARFTVANQFFSAIELEGGEETDIVIRATQGPRAFGTLLVEWETVATFGGAFHNLEAELVAGE